MATGTFLTGFLYTETPGLSQNVPGDHALPIGEFGGLSPAPVLVGPLTSARPISIRSAARTGARAATFLNDWYNRIHVLPQSIDFGAVAGESQRQATIWNAYLAPSTLTTITATSGAGTSLGGVAEDDVFGPLEARTITLFVAEEGPIVVGTQYAFSFDGRPDIVELSLIGRRARVWPFAPNWRSSVDVTLEYRTDITTSRRGNEQRRSLRKAPRRELSYGVTINQSDMRVLHRLMTKWQARPWFLPDPTRSVTVTSGAPIGGTVITVDDVQAWMIPGQTVMLGDQTIAIQSVDVDSRVVTLDALLTAAVRVDDVMRPAVTGRISGDIQAKHPSSGATEFNFKFAVLPGSEPEDAGQPGVDLLDGREVFIQKPNWGNAVESTYSWPVETIDFDFGRTATYVPQGFGSMVRKASFVSQTEDEAIAIQQFFARQRGRRGEFLMPTWLHDIPVVGGLVSGTNVFVAAGEEVYETYDGGTVYQAIAIVLSDGRRLYRRISGMVRFDGDTAVFLDEPWAIDISADEILMVSWMPVVRFANDALTVEWLTNTVAQVAVAMQTLEYLPAENPINTLDGAARWLLENWGLFAALAVLDRYAYLVNIRYPAVFFVPEAWSEHNEDVVDSLVDLIDRYGEVML